MNGSQSICPSVTGLFHLAYIMSLKIYPSVRISFLFFGQIIFHCMCLPRFIYPLIHQGTLELLPAFGYYEWYVMDRDVANMVLKNLFRRSNAQHWLFLSRILLLIILLPELMNALDSKGKHHACWIGERRRTKREKISHRQSIYIQNP